MSLRGVAAFVPRRSNLPFNGMDSSRTFTFLSEIASSGSEVSPLNPPRNNFVESQGRESRIKRLEVAKVAESA